MATYPNNYQRKKTIYWNDGSTARVLYPDEQEKQYRDYGNTAPKVEPARETAPKKQEVQRPVRTPKQTPSKEAKTRTYAKPKVDHNIGFFSMCILLAAILATLYTCFMYLKVQSETVVITKEIRQLEDELASVQDRNEAACNEVLDAVNLDEVYRVAVQELGMVYPNKNKTVYYQSAENGYVRQFNDIPKADKLELLKMMMR